MTRGPIRAPALALAVAALTGTLLASAPVEHAAPTRWAFIVGIGDYVHFEDVEGGDLPGAAHDARAMRDVLVGRYGFPEENVRLLLDRDATRAAMEEGITGWLAERVRPGDNVVVFFAGHGSQVWDDSGDEDDGLDETLAPADVLPDSPELDITDDEFNRWLATIPTDNVVVVLDHCNSGTATRAVTPFSRARRLGRDVQALPRPPGAGRRALPGRGTDPSGFDGTGARVLELAAAQADQAAVEAFFPGGEGAEAFHGGAFTTFLVRRLWRAPAGATYLDVFTEVRQALRHERFQQDPHISDEGSLGSSPLFSVDGGGPSAARASLTLESVEGDRGTLDGGLTLGVSPGAVFETASGAMMVVESARPDRSSVRMVTGTARNGEQAALTGLRFSVDPLRVGVAGLDSESAAALENELAASPGVDVVDGDPAAFSHLVVQRRGTTLQVVGSDGWIRHRDIPAGAEGAPALARILRQEGVAKTLADMENPAPAFQVSLALGGARTSLGLGETVSFHVTSERDGHLTLVDLGTDGTVVVLFPNAHHPSAFIRAGETLSFPTEEMDFELTVLPPAGRGVVRAFVTSRP
ncbi:MAG: caspase family protein, partial [Gemmatimonadota bacterium]|nr:caspase family protein [Gemmatimonadota bacterium]